MTKKNGKKLAARARQEQLGGRYEAHLRQVGGIEGDGVVGERRVGLSDGTRRILRLLISAWQAAKESERDPGEHRAFDAPTVILERALARADATDADIGAAIPLCPGYPNYGRSALRELADAERRGLLVEVTERQDGVLAWNIQAARPDSHPLKPLDQKLHEVAQREAACAAAVLRGDWQAAGIDAAWCSARTSELASVASELRKANEGEEFVRMEATIAAARKRMQLLFVEAKAGPHTDVLAGLEKLKRGLDEFALRAIATQDPAIRRSIETSIRRSRDSIDALWTAATDIVSGMMRDEEKGQAVTPIEVQKTIRLLEELRSPPGRRPST